MAVNPYIAKVIAQTIITQITDEEKRQRLVIGIIITISVILLIALIPLFAILSTVDELKSYFVFNEDGITSNSDYYFLIDIHNNYIAPVNLSIEELEYNGTFPMPVQNAVITCEFGDRIHPITNQRSLHTGIDIAGAWHSNITAVENGIIVFAGIQRGYGNCVEIQHTSQNGTIYYTFYAHLGRIDVVNGQEVIKGTVIGIQGGDPQRDTNTGYSTGTHLHFEIRMSQNGDFINPKEYLYGNQEV